MSKVITSRDFNQDISSAKRAAEDEPVFITSRGEPAHVLLSYRAYQELTGKHRSIVDMLAMPEDVEFEPARLEPADLQIPDFS